MEEKADPMVGKRKVQENIARHFLKEHGVGAYVLLLAELEDSKSYNKKYWRELLTIMEEIEKEQPNADTSI